MKMLKATLILISIFASIPARAWNTPAISKMGNTNTKWLWTGAGANSLWTNGANWCGTYRNGFCEGTSSGPPSSGAAVIFDNTCVANANNCSPTGIPATAFTFTGLHLKSTFPGTVAFNGNVNVNTSGGNFLLDGGSYSNTTGNLTALNFKMTGGTFTGGSGAITFGGSSGNVVTMSGGSFTSTTGTLTSTADTFNLTGLTSFSHAGGSISLVTTGNSTQIYPNGFTFNNLTLKACNRTHTLNGNIILDGNYFIGVSGSNSCNVTINGFYVELKSGSYYKQGGLPAGSTSIKFTGSGQQWIDTTGTGNGYGVPPVIVAQTVTGSVKFNGRGDLKGWDDTATLGTIDPNGQIIAPWSGTYNSTAILWPSIMLRNVASAYTAFTALSTTDLVLAATTTGIGNPTGEIKVYGNVTADTGLVGFTGGVVVNMTGTAAQNINLTAAATQYFPFLKINKTGGNLTFTGVPIISGGFNYVAGSYTVPAHVQFGNGTTGGSATITSNGFQFGDVDWVGYNNYVFADDMNITGDVTVANTLASGFMNGPGLVKVAGRISSTAGAIGYYASSTMTGFKLVGTSQIVDLSASSGTKVPGLHFYSSTGATVTGTFALHGTTSGTIVDHGSGSVDATNSSISISSTGAPTFTIKPGSIAFGGITFINNATNTISGSTLTVNGTLSMAAIATGRLLNGPIDAYGDVSYSSWGYGGSHSVTFKGNTSNFSVVGSPAYTSQNITVAKTAGQKLNLATDFSVSAGKSLSVTSGQVDLVGHALTISGGGALTLSGTGLKLSSGTLTVNGSNIGAGPYGGGTIVP